MPSRTCCKTPPTDPQALAYFERVARDHPEMGLKVSRLPEAITGDYVLSIDDQPGLLSLALVQDDDVVRCLPFVVPGGRFNELYGWDSYFEALGLLQDGRLDLARAMVEHFLYELSRYFDCGTGMPPETEEGHFDSVLRPYAKAAGLDAWSRGARLPAES